MTAALSPAARAARAQVLVDLFAGGTLEFYGGTRPSFGTTSGLQLQATVALDTPAATLSGATLILTAPVEALRTDNKAITWARFVDASNAPVLDIDVTGTSGTGDIKLSNTLGLIGGFVQLSSFTIVG